MPWYFLTAGFILIGISLYEKIKIYKNSSSNSSGNIEVTAEKTKVSPDLEKKLDQILNILESNKNDILEEIEQQSSFKSYSKNRDIGGSFKNILQKKYEKEANVDKKLPKKYQKVFPMRSRGKKTSDIARELNIGIRETRLILKLYYEYKNDKGQMQDAL